MKLAEDSIKVLVPLYSSFLFNKQSVNSNKFLNIVSIKIDLKRNII
jgi:hypothetical protein